MKLSYVVLAAVSFAVAAPAVAGDSPDSAKPAKEKKICRRETVTGSIVPFKTTCHTKSEWASIDAENARAVDSMANNRPSGTQRP
ncbi:MAG: hypothetical protein E7773_08670 [Sphingomonas sp.]|uniref:hypothetical protein n=1 Tax=Sphingomonas sp. TaxID=28214 RepID=UPI00120A0550|nr:hypothetical protein [Sphingomonas sp.]THD36007.1 MAG: hypothetical protein E7773_08670 [Sphingomonas sp.]